MNLSQELRIMREQLGVTQEYLADLSGVGLRTIKSFEHGKANPSL
jgi:DNA-binding XRE family transcriptional regulator